MPRRREPGLDVPKGGEGRNEVELLEDEAERAQPQVGEVAIRESSEIATFEEDVALARAVECTEQLEQCRLARAARALEGNKLAGVDLEVDAVDRADRLVPTPKEARRSA